jgi:hypothetical protein
MILEALMISAFFACGVAILCAPWMINWHADHHH